jgi:hypothetical protein
MGLWAVLPLLIALAIEAMHTYNYDFLELIGNLNPTVQAFVVTQGAFIYDWAYTAWSGEDYYWPARLPGLLETNMHMLVSAASYSFVGVCLAAGAASRLRRRR